MHTGFDLARHMREYHYDYVTVIDGVMADELCAVLVERIERLIGEGRVKLVDHQGLGTEAVSDSGGRYLHHIFEGDDIRRHLPELTAVYQAVLPLISSMTSQDVVLSPYPRSDINIKVYPPGGGTLGEHYDTNGVTVLLFLTTNREAPLRMQIPRSHPAKGQWTERRSIHATAGSLLVMKGREVLHDCEPTVNERKISAVLNYYVRGDTWRHESFDSFVYDGVTPPRSVEVQV
ncbi:hypothetical protein [Luteibacter yeojuensis]|uniref:Fe2OG dioxygenase domain-containing protein n=1 Tax=Luteibacter yeojuensis TaxID=345309 RepID=A0A7X5TQT9_9GAMM|nr:hypothetical protein [Luteibacter yeojuensis]NID16174.1 hypothetical protein [Luteibacter yeojuensis]